MEETFREISCFPECFVLQLLASFADSKFKDIQIVVEVVRRVWGVNFINV